MKKIQNQKIYKCVHTRGQKIRGWLALIMLFICGLMVGVSISDRKTEQQESTLVQAVQEIQQTQQKETCAVIEEIQLRWLNDENSGNIVDHQANVRVYETLFQHGCDENKDKYRAAIVREMAIIDALGGQQSAKSTCEQIEASLLERLPYGGTEANADDRIDRAKIYANLSERGCAENSAKYVELAKQELEIARALEDDEFTNHETIEVVETYKRLNMQAAAEEIFETAKKLTNPAIDFILEVEKIINEQ
ncbi:MAG: hypothetical protein R8N50_00165 [Alphaproteobacteria bacterium]|nr:hypothetical protein [Alphaproteobacteria bacterium]